MRSHRFGVVGILLIQFCATAGAAGKATLTVTALGYRVIPHESTTYYRTPGYSNTSCYGNGTYFGGTVSATATCSTVTTPPQSQPVTIRSVEVYNQVEAGGMVYTVRCKASWIGSNCSWLTPGDVFMAEIQDTAMWIVGRKGGNLGKEVRAKHQLLDMRSTSQTQSISQPGFQRNSTASTAFPPGTFTGNRIAVIAPSITTALMARETMSKLGLAQVKLDDASQILVVVRSGVDNLKPSYDSASDLQEHAERQLNISMPGLNFHVYVYSAADGRVSQIAHQMVEAKE